MGRRSLLSYPVVVGSVIVALLAARWIWVAGLGDYGWTYEVASRLLHGQVYYRDFPLLYGPLSHYTLAGLMYLLGDHLLVSHLHLWLSYALAVWAGLQVIRALGAGPGAQLTGVALAAVMGCPVFSWGHAFNYQATFLGGMAVVCVLHARRRDSLIWAALAGAAAALAIYSKQNIGLAAAALIPVSLRKSERAAYLACLAGVFVAVFGYFSFHAGAWEVWRQLFVDAAAAKGGVVRMAGRAVPRVILNPDSPFRRWWELAASGVAWAAALIVARRVSRRPASGNENRHQALAGGAGLVTGAVAAVAFSLLHIEPGLAARAVVEPWPLFLQLTYIVFAACAAARWFREPYSDQGTALLLVLAMTAVQEGSNPNLVYSAPLVVPLLCGLWSDGGAAPLAGWTAGATVAFVYLLGTTAVGPPAVCRLCAYQPTYALPDDSPFGGLRAPAHQAQLTQELWQHLRPVVRNRRTLWLTAGGPHAAYGGTPVFGAPCYMADTVPRRLEARLIHAWQQDPPEVVILKSNFQVSADTRLLRPEYIIQNVLGRHREEWRSKIEPELGVWVKEPAP